MPNDQSQQPARERRSPSASPDDCQSPGGPDLYTCRDPRCGFCHLARQGNDTRPFRLFTFTTPSGAAPMLSAGLPLPSTAPLTAAERETCHQLATGFRNLAALIEDAAGAGADNKGRVDLTLQALSKGVELGDMVEAAALRIGRGR